MREALERAGIREQPADAHPGLWWSRVASIPLEEGEAIPPDEKARLIRNVCEVRVPDVYRSAYRTWREAIEKDAFVWEFKLTSRLLIGHGEPSAIGIGLTLHPTYGVPWIPGSAVKGLLAHYLGMSEDEWRGVGYAKNGGPPRTLGDGAPVRAPANWSRVVFGAPPTPDVPSNDTQGCVDFVDAWFNPFNREEGNGSVLVPDVLTPHQKRYYDGKVEAGKPWVGKPIDWDDPNPVGFVTVRPGVSFLFAMGFARGADSWAKLAFRQLADALRICGLGGKTRAGYGRFEPLGNGSAPAPPRRRAPEPCPAACSDAFMKFTQAVELVQSADTAKLAVFRRQDFRALALSVPQAERTKARRLFMALCRHKKLQREEGTVIQEVEAVLTHD